MIGPRYILCPKCGGAASEKYNKYDEDGADEYVEKEPCFRCDRAGVITEDQATDTEIEAERKYWEEVAEARNRVDF